MKLAEIGDRGDLRETQIIFQVLSDEFFYATKFVAGKSAGHGLGHGLRRSVMSQQMKSERLNQRIRKQSSGRGRRIGFLEQGQPQLLDQRIALFVNFREFKSG